MLIRKNESCVVLVDVQQKLTPLVLNADALVSRCKWVLSLARRLNVDVLVTEQYPKGLGSTHHDLADVIAAEKIEKTYFSCVGEFLFTERLLALNKRQIILIGIETHVCVLQTALRLIEMDNEVFIVVDAVSARHDIDHRYGLKRMKQAKCQLITAEMLFFEWLEHSKHPDFKVLSQTFLR